MEKKVTSSLTWLGVTPFGMIKTGMIIGLLEIQEEQQQKTKELIDKYSFSVSLDIAERLIQKTIKDYPDIDSPFRKYLGDNLIPWIQKSITWTSAGAVLNETTLIEVSHSEINKLQMTGQEFFDYLNKTWFKYVKLTDFKTEEDKGITFLFILTT